MPHRANETEQKFILNRPSLRCKPAKPVCLTADADNACHTHHTDMIHELDSCACYGMTTLETSFYSGFMGKQRLMSGSIPKM